MQQHVIIKRTGVHRLLYTFIHSFNGFKWLCKNETAFQQELILFIPLTVFAFWLDLPTIHTLMVILGMVFVLLAEMVNTAIEAVVDRISLDYHELSGVAKNIGSAIVLLSIVCSLTVWGTVLYLRWTRPQFTRWNVKLGSIRSTAPDSSIRPYCLRSPTIWPDCCFVSQVSSHVIWLSYCIVWAACMPNTLLLWWLDHLHSSWFGIQQNECKRENEQNTFGWR